MKATDDVVREQEREAATVATRANGATPRSADGAPAAAATLAPSLLVPYLWLGVLALIWGASFLFIKLSIRAMSPEVLTLIRPEPVG